MLLTYADSLRGVEPTPASDIRDLCKDHTCFDSSNFAGTLKAQKELFLISGSGPAWSARLSVPGKVKAIELAKTLNNS
jgi:hypothetical protein